MKKLLFIIMVLAIFPIQASAIEEIKGAFGIKLWQKFDEGNHSVTVRCSGLMDYSIDILYMDYRLAKQSKKEILEIDTADMDSSGL